MRKCLLLLLICAACRQKQNTVVAGPPKSDTPATVLRVDATARTAAGDSSLPQRIVSFAKTQLGVNYKYCSMNPDAGFDCSGFVNYVFNHFGIKVPRSSVEFTNVGEEIPLKQAQPGDLILFTGTNPGIRTVGHIGIVTDNNDGDIHFIQSTSGAAYGVVISPLEKRYMQRFVKVVRIAK